MPYTYFVRVYDVAFYSAIVFILGIAGASLKINIWLVIFGSAVLISVLDRRVVVSPIWLSLFLIFALSGYFYFNLFEVRHQEKIIFDQNISFSGIVIKEPHNGFNKQELTVKLLPPYQGEVKVYTQLYPVYNYGDILKIRGRIVKSPGNLNLVNFPELELERHQGNFLKSFLFSLKKKLVDRLTKVLPQEKSAFITGLLFGEKAEFSQQFKTALNKSGTAHLVALSGYNVSIIVTSFANFFSYFWRKQKAFWFDLILITAFVLMTGAEESVVRAAIMGVIALVAQRSSRLYSPRNAIALTALLMLLVNPRWLVFNVGFQLSFMALLGLVYLKPVLERLLINIAPHWSKEAFLNWKESLLQTLAAQLAVLPILISTFGYFSPWSLLANMLILGLIPLTMFLGFLTVVVGILSFHLSLLAALPLSILLGYEIFIINFFGGYLT